MSHAAALSVGVDVVDVARFRAVLARRPTLAGRLFTAGEQAYGRRARDPAQRLAARFAAKEATMKALGVGLGAVDFADVEVVRDDGGAPALVLSGRAAALAARRGVGGWRVSLTHTDQLAAAVVLALAPAPPTPPTPPTPPAPEAPAP